MGQDGQEYRDGRNEAAAYPGAYAPGRRFTPQEHSGAAFGAGTEPRSGVLDVLERHGRTLYALESQIEQLEKALAPALQPEAQTGPGGVEKAAPPAMRRVVPPSQMTVTIENLTMRVEMMAARLHGLMERLEI